MKQFSSPNWEISQFHSPSYSKWYNSERGGTPMASQNTPLSVSPKSYPAPLLPSSWPGMATKVEGSLCGRSAWLPPCFYPSLALLTLKQQYLIFMKPGKFRAQAPWETTFSRVFNTSDAAIVTIQVPKREKGLPTASEPGKHFLFWLGLLSNTKKTIWNNGSSA